MKKILNYFLNKKWILSIIMRFLSEEKKEKIQIEILRNELIFFGYDISNLSDAEIKKVVETFAKAIGSFRATIDETAKALRVLSNCT